MSLAKRSRGSWPRFAPGRWGEAIRSGVIGDPEPVMK